MATPLTEDAVRRIVADVVGRLGAGDDARTAAPAQTQPSAAPPSAPSASVRSGGASGIFEDGAEAAAAAAVAQLKLRAAGFAGRAKAVEIVKRICSDQAEAWGRLELEETRIGRLDHKIQKLQVIRNVPGVEWLRPLGMSGDHGITMEETTPFGVIGAITPVTHSIPTISCNIINMVAAGNTVVVNPHPGGARCAATAVAEFNRAFERELGIPNLATLVREPTLDSFDAICRSEHVQLICVTGGPMVVAAAMKSGKRAICAGPGNPPVLVDETAHLDKAARNIITGAAYDNNLLCIGEKQIYVTAAAYDRFLSELEQAGAIKLTPAQLERLSAEVFTMEGGGGGCAHPVLNRDLVGADAAVLAARAGAAAPAGTQVLFAETDADHPFVMVEQMMPMLPVVRVRDVAEGIREAARSEHGYKHSAMIHSLNVEHMTAMVQALDCTLFVKNGPCMAGLGDGGEGYLSFSVATATGEGITTPSTFTRNRRCVMVDQLRMY